MSSLNLAGVFLDALAEHLTIIRQLETQQDSFERAAILITDSLLRGNKILWCGNGGSAADSQHLAAELVGRFRHPRAALASIALTTNSSVLTAIGNDFGFEEVFQRQVEALCQPGDVLVGISTSGTSRNVCAALSKARELRAGTVVMTGSSANRMSTLGRCLYPRAIRGPSAHSRSPHPLWTHSLPVGRTRQLHKPRRIECWERAMTASLRTVLPLLASGWQHVPVLVVGDVMLDQYVWGEVDRISPEAPVPVVRASFRDEKPGGAANVAMNLAGLGASVTLVGFAGRDREHSALEGLLADREIRSRLVTTSERPTTAKLRILSGHQQMMRLDMESPTTFSADDYRRLLGQAYDALEGCRVVVLSDYAKGALGEEVCQALIREARRRQIPILVDPKCRSFARYSGATAVCPNRKELAAATGETSGKLATLLKAGQAMLGALDVQFMAVTLGEKGIAVLRPSDQFRVPAVVRQVFDVSGAGDTVIAVLALASACDVPIEAAARLANIAAGIVVGKVGTVPITKDELVGALSGLEPLAMDEKVLPLDQLLAGMTAWRANGDRIVFTNGCFDILHIGHIRLLEEARRKGDRLIVGINSDGSVRELKGPLRPIVGERERARILAALSAVDAVVLFEESNPLRLIEAIRPDILVKGGDYTEELVVGAREVRAWGGRLELIPLVEGISSTRLIASAAAPPPTTSKIFSA